MLGYKMEPAPALAWGS